MVQNAIYINFLESLGVWWYLTASALRAILQNVGGELSFSSLIPTYLLSLPLSLLQFLLKLMESLTCGPTELGSDYHTASN